MSGLRATPSVVLLMPAIMQSLLLLLGIVLLVDISSALGRQAVPAEPIAVQPPLAAIVTQAQPPAAPQDMGFLSPRMRSALAYASRRYHVSAEALAPIFATVQRAAHSARLDPLLIVAVIAIESRFNPFSESIAGAQGLMQVIPRYHKDKLPEGSGSLPLFDPAINVRVGTQALHEYIRRNGDLIGGLQQFGGDPDDPERSYAARVLAEKERFENAGRELVAAGLPEIR